MFANAIAFGVWHDPNEIRHILPILVSATYRCDLIDIVENTNKSIIFDVEII